MSFSEISFKNYLYIVKGFLAIHMWIRSSELLRHICGEKEAC